MKTVLELYCEFAGWQGGTIHQALTDYLARPLAERDRFCNQVFNHGLGNVADLATFSDFTRARL